MKLISNGINYIRPKHNILRMSRAHSPTFPSLHLHHSSFSNPSVALPTSQLILQPFCCFAYSQLILHSFCCFTYVTAHSPTLLSLLQRHRIFTYFTWRATHGKKWRKMIAPKTASCDIGTRPLVNVTTALLASSSSRIQAVSPPPPLSEEI